MRQNKTLSTLTLRRPRGRSLLFGLAALLWGGSVQAQTYCASSVYTTYALCRVDFADMTSAPTSGNGYVDNTAIVASVSQAMSYTLSVSSNTNYGWYISAFFDWDHDGTFETKVNVGIAGTCPGAPLTGTITVPANAVNTTTRMRIVSNYSGYVNSTDGCGTNTYGQVLDYSVQVGAPPTCLAPASATVSNITTTTADLAWTASTSGPSGGYQWEVRASGNPGDPSPAASGSTATTTATATGLTSGVATYKLYVRADCGGGDLSAWKASAAFETATSLSCGSTWVSPGGVNNLTDVRFIRTYTVCPSTSGDVATVDFTTWNGLNWNVPQKSGIFIYNGDNTSAPQIMGPGAAYSETGWSIPAGGWTSANTTNKPPITTSTAANGCLTIAVYSYGIWTGGMGWSAEVTCAPPPTCFPPTAISVVTTTSGGVFSFTGTSTSYEYKVVTAGSPSSAAAIVSGTSASSPATITGLTAGTPYTAYFRGDCGGGDLSSWSPVGKNFRTVAGCNGPVDLYSTTSYAGYTPIPTGGIDSVVVICPDNSGDVVKLTMTKFSFGQGGNGVVGLLVHNGNSTAAPIFDSGLPAKTYLSSTLPAGAYWGDTYRVPGSGVLPGPFTSSAANGCLTLNFKAYSGSTYDEGMTSNVTCAPAPDCSTPNNVTFSNIGGSSATVTWGNTTEPSIIEYGPMVGFTPGTGATAGTGGTVVSNATPPYLLTGLSGTTKYKVYVRQVCSGSTYSANSFAATVTTSMDCSTAQVLSCSQVVSDDGAPAEYTTGNAAYGDNSYTGAASCLGGGGAANGTERLYRFTASAAGTYGILAGISDVGNSAIGYVVTPVANGCAASAFTCIGTVPANVGGNLTFNVPAAGVYYIMSDANSSVHKRPFTLACPGVPTCAAAPLFPANNVTLASTSTPILFSWPAVFGATAYDFYFNGTLLVADYPATTISDPSYTSAAVAALVGIGNPVTWKAVPKNSFGTAVCPTDWSFRAGGNGAANAIPLTDGVAYSGNRNLANGYTNLNTTYNGRDSWYKFTASTCADSAQVNICLPAFVNAVALQVRQVSDNALVFPPTGFTTPTTPYYSSVAAGACFQFQYYNYDISNWVFQTPIFPVVPGESYYVIADGYASDYSFQITYNEVVDPTDDDADGIPNCADSCPFAPGSEGQSCVAAGFASGKIIDCECVGGNMATVSITTDSNPTQTSWEITNENAVVVASGAPTAGQANTTVNETVFLAGSCYGFKLMDSAGDGIANGGWELRTTDGKTILKDGFGSGSVSPVDPGATATYGSSSPFCLPLGTASLKSNECGLFGNTLNSRVYANTVPGATQYEFQFLDPDGGYVRSVVKGGNSVLFIDFSGPVNALVPGNKYFVRLRTNAAGPLASATYGPGCEMGLTSVGIVRCTQLINAPSYGHSCNETRAFGSSASSFIYATPVLGANAYTFHIYIPGEPAALDTTITRGTYILQLKWPGRPMANGSTYNVDVKTTVNGIQSNYCNAFCTVTINNGYTGLINELMPVEEVFSGDVQLWPNPVADGRVNLALNGLVDADQQIQVELYDMYGKKVLASAYDNSGSKFSTVLELPSEVSSGVYLVHLSVNGVTTVQRLSVVR